MVHKMTISGFFNYAFVGFCPMIDLVKCVYLQVLDVLGEAKKKKKMGAVRIGWRWDVSP